MHVAEPERDRLRAQSRPTSAGASTLLHFDDAERRRHRDHQGASRQPAAVHHRPLDPAVEPLPRRGRPAQRATGRRAHHREERRTAHRARASRRCTSPSASPRGGIGGLACTAPVLLRPLGDPSPPLRLRAQAARRVHREPRARPRAARRTSASTLDGPALAALAVRRRRVQAAAGHRPHPRARPRSIERSPSTPGWSSRPSPTSAPRWRAMPSTSTTRC